jgi:hypothetical protein
MKYYTVSRMNGRPVRYGSFTDYGEVGRRQLVGRHTSIDAAMGAVARALEPSGGRLAPGSTWWIAEIAANEDRGHNFVADWHQRRVVAGSFDADNRPSRLFRLGR